MSFPQQSMPASLPRNHGIDSLRGLAILLVVLHHMGLRIALKSTALADFLPARVLNAFNYNGYEAVFVFFVISGFLIASHALARYGRLAQIDVRAFYVRRATRIVPCLVLLVAVLALLDGLGAKDYVIDREGQSLGRAIVAAFGLHLNWYEGATGYLPGNWDVLWSLSIEETFYLGFPLLCLSVRSERLLAIVLVALVLVLPFSLMSITDNEIWKEKAYLPGMAAIAAGVLVALIARCWMPRRRVATALAAIGVAGLLTLMFAMRELWPLFHDTVMLLLVVCSACLVLALAWLHDGSARPLRATGWLRSMGRLSYEIYLGHMFVVFAVVAAFNASGGNLHQGYLWYLPAVLLAWALGALVARLYTLPCESWLRKRLQKLRVPRTGLATVTVA